MMKLSRKYWFLAIIFGGIVIIVVTALGIHNSSDDYTKELQLVHIVMRHGARTPQSTYPNDPYINETFFPYGWGQLTNIGKQQLYEMGKYFRKRYGNFLGDDYTAEKYYTQTTDVDRTRASAEVINAGLWPPPEKQKWGSLNWQPIPVHAEPLSLDSLLLVRIPCPQYQKELDRVKQTEEIKEKFSKYSHLFGNLTQITGQEIDDFEGVLDIHGTLKAEQHCNLTLPEWTKHYYPEKILDASIFSYVLNVYTDKLNRLKGGVLLKKLLNDWQAKASGTIKPINRKAFLYIGHDSTVVNLLSALNVFNPHVPDYAATIFIELHKDIITNQYGIEVYYKANSSAEAIFLRIPDCDNFCPLSKLTDLIQNVIPKNWDEECATNDRSYTVPPPKLP